MQPRMGAGDDQLRAALVLVHLDQEHLDPLAGPVALVRHLLASRHDRLGLAQLDDDGPRIGALHDAVQHLALLVVKLLVDRIALVVADALQDDLLHGLRGDAAEVLRGALDANLVADPRVGRVGHRLGQRHLAEGILDLVDHLLDGKDAHGAGGLVDIDGDLLLGVRHLLVDALQSMFDRGEHRLFGDSPLGGNLGDRRVEVALHARNAPFLGRRQMGGPVAGWRTATSRRRSASWAQLTRTVGNVVWPLAQGAGTAIPAAACCSGL